MLSICGIPASLEYINLIDLPFFQLELSSIFNTSNFR